MNKKFIALAVAALVSGAANAASIYEDEATTVGISGEIDTFLSQFESDVAGADLDADADLWAKIQVDAQHKLNDTVTVFGSFEMENGESYGENGSKDIKTDDLYFGANIGEHFGIAAGETGDFADSFNAITIDNTNEGYGYMDDFVSDFESDGHTIALKYDIAGLELVADTYLDEDSDADNAYGVSASYTVAGFNIGASYQDHGNRTTDKVDGKYVTNNGDNDVYGVKLGYSGDSFSIATHYVVEQKDSVDTNVIGLAADYKFDAARIYASGFVADQDDAEEDLTAYTVGADYAFSNNVLAFVEYSAQENSEYTKDTDTALYLAGIYYTF
ncbi:MAG: porin [Vibrio sp.]|uniref:porin n=1 Tax=Vibrio sp. TaxID=678 RepID=UPI003A8ACB77